MQHALGAYPRLSSTGQESNTETTPKPNLLLA